MSKKEKCGICGKTLSIYNNTGNCFHHRYDKLSEKALEMRELFTTERSICMASSMDKPFNRVQHEYNNG